MINSIVKAVEAAAQYAWGLIVVCVFLLFTPDNLASKIGVLDIRTQYLGYIWILLVFSSTIFLSSVVSKIVSWMVANRREYKKLTKIEDQKIDIIKRLNSLNDKECTWIACSLFKRVQTLHATQINPTANSLLSKGIVTCGPGSIMALPFTIRDFVWEHLLEYKDNYLPENIESDQNAINQLERFEDNLKRVV